VVIPRAAFSRQTSVMAYVRSASQLLAMASAARIHAGRKAAQFGSDFSRQPGSDFRI